MHETFLKENHLFFYDAGIIKNAVHDMVIEGPVKAKILNDYLPVFYTV